MTTESKPANDCSWPLSDCRKSTLSRHSDHTPELSFKMASGTSYTR